MPLIEIRDFFFLSTVSALGEPTVSYKDGTVGLLKVIDSKVVIFLSDDGNGMFNSMRNVATSNKVGMLFIGIEIGLSQSAKKSCLRLHLVFSMKR